MLKRFAAALTLALAAPVAAQDAPAQPRTDLVVLETALGDITLAIESERAPVTAANFLRYVDERRLDGTVFYRAMRLAWGEQPNGLIQGGTQYDPKRVLPPIAHEPTTQTGLSHTAGAISMARYAPGTATGDFSIMVSDQPSLDADPKGETDDARAGFAVFGHVVSGMVVVRQIFAAPTDPDKGEGFMKGQMLAQPVTILHAHRVKAS
jgi:peptidyl-prolyl cis-trans isomerase A (cyclophilin A)|uniref:peptidylprolyl isomerase n=1 Tax=Altererythrobacter segetis TaxID=1104773 RepID=UPI001407C772|nr:peptidylprolyl isomerase [Altererythrobacter segetis]